MIDFTAADLRRDFNDRRQSIEFFDSNAWFGPTAHGFESAQCMEELDAVLQFAHAGSAIVTHTSAVGYDWNEGNGLTLQAIAGRADRSAAVALVPDSTGEVNSAEYVAGATARGARAARLFPKTHSFSMADWCIGSVLRVLQERKMPLILWHSEVSWEAVHDVCLHYPQLPVIVEGTGRKILYDNRTFYAALADCPNLHLELHNLTNYLIVEDIVGRFRAGRLVFGSYAPYQSPSAPMMAITHARISEDDKMLIAGGNIRRMIGEVRL